jgi:hypothetical protein
MRYDTHALTSTGRGPEFGGGLPPLITKWYDVKCYLSGFPTEKPYVFETIVHVQASSPDIAETLAAEQFYHGLLMKVKAEAKTK